MKREITITLAEEDAQSLTALALMGADTSAHQVSPAMLRYISELLLSVIDQGTTQTEAHNAREALDITPSDTIH